jgi:thiol-disulfide isomerase/thioredoxin
MPKKKRRKNSSFPKALIVVGVVLLAAVVLLLKDKPQAATTSASVNDLPESQLVNALQAGQPTLAFYHSTDCEQCIIMMDVVAQVYPEYQDGITLVDVDVYDQRNALLLNKVRLQYIPTLMFYNRSGERQVHVGVMEADKLHEALAAIGTGR